MQYLGFINTNIGPAAVRRRPNAELLFYSQVWLRTGTGEWKRYHFFTKDKYDISSGMLESMYRNARTEDLPVEDWW